MSNPSIATRTKVMRRPPPRRRVLLGGLITYAQGTHCFSCAIRDLSAAGARISMKPRHALPSNIFLINLRDRVAYECRTIWSKGVEAGLAIDKVMPLNALNDSRFSFLKRLGDSHTTRMFVPTV
jgi:hypothetical protein